jgi:heat shock protein HslJ
MGAADMGGGAAPGLKAWLHPAKAERSFIRQANSAAALRILMNNKFLRAAIVLFAASSATFALAQMRMPGDDTVKPLPPQQKNFPLDQTWSLRDINDKPIPAGLDASLKIDGNLRGSGYTGCNSWSATLYPVKDQHLLLGPYALTKKQCAKDVMAVEFSFLSALTGSPTWDLVNGDLVIKGPKGSLRLARSL